MRHLAPTTSVVACLRNAISDVVTRLVELTSQQVLALGGMRRNRRAVVFGPAGSGKTILAAERARRLADEGFTVLLTCYSRPLAESLATELGDAQSVVAANFHHLVMQRAAAAGIAAPLDPTREWWDSTAANVLIEASDATGYRVDAIVADEAQDFPSEWIEALMLLLRDPDDGPFYMFADSQQAIFHKGWHHPPSWPVFDLDINCRSTLPIARRVAAVFGQEPLSLGTDGPSPRFVLAATDDEVLDLVPELLDRLIDAEHLEPAQCVVLHPRREIVERFHRMVTSEHALVGLGKRGVVVETIQRFKGLEADVCIVVLAGLDLAEPEARALAYVGLSRARAMLFVLGTKDQRNRLGWGVADPHPSK